MPASHKPGSASNAPRQRRGAGLVLTRRSGQSIMIGDDIELTVLSVVGNAVRIGIDAPRDVKILRREIWRKG